MIGLPGSFNPAVPGLDHLALGVSDVAELEQWAAHFDSNGVPFSPIEESEFGHHLNVRSPDGIAVELFVLSAAGMAAVGASSIATAEQRWFRATGRSGACSGTAARLRAHPRTIWG